MHKIIIAFVLAALAAGPAAASEKTDVMAVLQQMVDAFNKGDVKSILATCTEVTSIIDDFPPHEWYGTGACAKWFDGIKAYDKANGIGSWAVALGKPRHVDISAEHAYVVVPANYTFTMKGKPMKQSNSVQTLVFQKDSSGWHVTAWAWADGVQTEVKTDSGK